MADTRVAVDGRNLKLSNLDKVLYPRAGFTKAEVIDYYARVAPVMVPHLRGRPVTFVRWPDGVEGHHFFEKNCPSHRPPWVPTHRGPGDIDYCALDEPAALVWAANLAALELHTPMARATDPSSPTMVVFDLDPGPGTGIPECARVAAGIREVLDLVGLEAWAKTSGSKGMQVYVPLNRPHTQDHAKSFALAVGQLMERERPHEVVTTMAKEARRDRVFIDWSQNTAAKTTVCVYSLRARPRPTVSTPVTWDEVDQAVDGSAALVFEADDVLARVEEHGDLFSPVLDVEQELPEPGT